MKYRYLKNLRDKKITACDDMSKITLQRPHFKSKALYREWCGKTSTDHCFFSMAEGLNSGARIEGENKVVKVHGVAADYDAPVDWTSVDNIIASKCVNCMPAWRARTYSGYIRIVFEFEEVCSVPHFLYRSFMGELAKLINFSKIFAGYDRKSEDPSQYFELGTEWVSLNGQVPSSIVQTALIKAAKNNPPESADTSIPIEEVAAEV